MINCQNKFFERKIHRIDEQKSQIHDHDKKSNAEINKTRNENLDCAR